MYRSASWKEAYAEVFQDSLDDPRACFYYHYVLSLDNAQARAKAERIVGEFNERMATYDWNLGFRVMRTLLRTQARWPEKVCRVAESAGGTATPGEPTQSIALREVISGGTIPFFLLELAIDEALALVPDRPLVESFYAR